MDDFIKLKRVLPLLQVAKGVRAVYTGGAPPAKTMLLGGVFNYLEQQWILRESGNTAADKEEQSKLSFNLRVAARLLREIRLDEDAWEIFCDQSENPFEDEFALTQLLFGETFAAVRLLYPAIRLQNVSKPDLREVFSVIEYWLFHGEAPEDDIRGEGTVQYAGIQLFGYLSLAIGVAHKTTKHSIHWGNQLGAVDLVEYHSKRSREEYTLLERPEWQASDDEAIDPDLLDSFDKPATLTLVPVLLWLRRCFLSDWNNWARLNDLNSALLIELRR